MGNRNGTWMRLNCGMLLCIGLALLIAGSIGICAAATGTGQGPDGNGYIDDLLRGVEPPKADPGMDGAQGAPPDEPPRGDPGSPEGVIFHNWKGFAIMGNDSHTLRVSIESIRPLEPMKVRNLLASNMSIEQIHDVIKKEEGAAVKRGAMKLSDYVYKLMDIRMTPSGNNTVLEADLGALRYNDPENNTAVLGHITVNLASEETADVSQGTLIVSSGKYAGKYKVLLDTQPPERGGRPGPGDPMVPLCAGQGCNAL